jgi:cytochrome c-type biogenesis protein CcmH/NrfF
MMQGLRIAVALAAALLATPLVAGAAEEWHYDLEQHLMSPYCPGRTLTDCTSPQAAELRQWIAGEEAKGRSREDVEKQLFLEFGEVILQAPKAQGFGLAAYVIPAVGVALGAALVVVFLRRQQGAATPPAPLSMAPDPDLDRRIDEELRRG